MRRVESPSRRTTSSPSALEVGKGHELDPGRSRDPDVLVPARRARPLGEQHHRGLGAGARGRRRPQGVAQPREARSRSRLATAARRASGRRGSRAPPPHRRFPTASGSGPRARAGARRSANEVEADDGDPEPGRARAAHRGLEVVGAPRARARGLSRRRRSRARRRRRRGSARALGALRDAAATTRCHSAGVDQARYRVERQQAVLGGAERDALAPRPLLDRGGEPAGVGGQRLEQRRVGGADTPEASNASS